MTEPARALVSAQPLAARSLRILFITTAQNSLSQRALVALAGLGHRVTVEVVDSGEAIEAAVARLPARADRLPDAQDDHPNRAEELRAH